MTKRIVLPLRAWMMTKNSLLAEILRGVVDETARRLSVHSDTPQLDAEVLVSYILRQRRTWLRAHYDISLDPEQAETLESLIQRLELGEPLPYVIGHWEFFGLNFDLTTDVLIPRPETELLVEHAIPWLQSTDKRRAVADIGTGCGCIALAITTHVPTAHVLATDISKAALEVARHNALKFHAEHQIKFVECDILPKRSSDESSFDLICANLPYIPTGKLHGLPVYGREPTLALDGGIDGLDLIRRLLAVAPNHLAPGGRMLLEIEATRGPAALSIAYDAFDEAEIHLYKDLAQHNRLLEIQLPLQ